MREDVLGSTMFDLFSGLAGTEVDDKCREAIRDGRPPRSEASMARSDDWLEVQLYPSESGLPIYYRSGAAGRRARRGYRDRARRRGDHLPGPGGWRQGVMGIRVDELEALVTCIGRSRSITGPGNA
jgi:hypothetical protein